MADNHLLNLKSSLETRSYVSVKDEIKFAFNTGFKDSYSLF